MYVFEYLSFNFKTQEFVMRLPIKAQIITQKSEKVKTPEKRKVCSHNKVR